MPPKRKATYATRAAQRRWVEDNNPQPSQLTVHSTAREKIEEFNLGTSPNSTRCKECRC